MKTGKSLSELAAEIERQHNAKRDLLLPSRAMSITAAGSEGAQTIMMEAAGAAGGLFKINGLAHDQIGQHYGVPGKYYDRMLAEAPGLLAANLNTWIARSDERRQLRTLDGNLRAFLSDKYRPLDNFDLATAVLPILAELQVEVMSCEITERRMYIKAVDRRILKGVPTGAKLGDGSHTFFDTVSPAIIIQNSEVGSGALSVEAGIFTKVCTNLAAIAKAGMKRYHVGARHELTAGESLTHLLSDETRKATDKAIWMQASDIVRGAFNEAKFSEHVDKLKEAAGVKITRDPVETVEVISKARGFNETERGGILRHLIEGGDLSKYGLHAAITRTAQDVESYDRATELEFAGWDVIELGANDWKRLAEAA